MNHQMMLDEHKLRDGIAKVWGESGAHVEVYEMVRAERDAARTELAQWVSVAQNGHPSPCTLGPLCPYCEIDRALGQIGKVE